MILRRHDSRFGSCPGLALESWASWQEWVRPLWFRQGERCSVGFFCPYATKRHNTTKPGNMYLGVMEPRFAPTERIQAVRVRIHLNLAS